MAARDHTASTAPESRQQRLSDRQRLDWLRLIRSENVGPVTFRDLINHFGGARTALEALPELSRRGGRSRSPEIYTQRQAETEIAAAEKIGAAFAALGEPGYPPWLGRIDTPPPLVCVKGHTELLEQPVVAIVGARNGSAIGQKFTRTLAADLGQEGFVIASGLARGIDTAAHAAALERGTLAVLAGGIDSVYPAENLDLQDEIGRKGVLLSERPMGFTPRGKDFPRRNRLISGVSAGVVVVEAARRSGSLITARFAGEQGREVFAVPGSPLDPRAAGTNGLLKDGATLVTSAEDVIAVLTPILGREDARAPELPGTFETGPDTPLETDVDPSDRERVVESLGPAPVDVDELIRATSLPAQQVHIILLELDLAGRIERHGRQLVSLKDSGEP